MFNLGHYIYVGFIGLIGGFVVSAVGGEESIEVYAFDASFPFVTLSRI
jgi:hypothetical protein